MSRSRRLRRVGAWLCSVWVSLCFYGTALKAGWDPAAANLLMLIVIFSTYGALLVVGHWCEPVGSATPGRP